MNINRLSGRADAAVIAGLCFLLLATLLGCSSPPTSQSTTSPRTHQVELYQTGGLAGVDNRLTVTDNGAVELVRAYASHQGPLQLTSSELSLLHSQLDAVDITKIPASRTNPSLRDGFSYTFIYQDRTVAFDETTVPTALSPAINTLTTLISRLSTQGRAR